MTSIVAVPDVRRHAVVLRRRPLIAIAMLAVASVAVGIVDVIGVEAHKNDDVHRRRSGKRRRPSSPFLTFVVTPSSYFVDCRSRLRCSPSHSSHPLQSASST
jgi:hypothetical protein